MRVRSPFPCRPSQRRRLVAPLAAVLLLPSFAAIAAPPAVQVVESPRLVPILRAALSPPAAALEGATPSLMTPVPDHDASLSLDIRLTDGRIYNPATGRYDHVRLRSYVPEGQAADPDTPFVAPTIAVLPGETVRIKLNNRLEPQPGCTPPNINTPHCFNSTNLHSHGLWVSPAGNSDNVLLTIRPNVSFEYEYNLPATHPAGTFWYHPHLHGSTALQVASGMAGALIVRGARVPTPQRNGDIDTLLRADDGQPFRERVVLFQQVPYACRDANGKIKTNPDGTWACGPDDVGEITDYADQLGFGTWAPSGRYTSINGDILPRFDGAVAGRIERWRNLHAGIRDTIRLQFVPMRVNVNPLSLREADDHAKWIGRNCVGDPLPQWEIATDGLTHAQVIRKTEVVLQPGYRSDSLMVFPSAGDYCVIDNSVPASGSVSSDAESRRLLGTVRVAPGDTVTGDLGAYLQRQLVEAANRWMPDDVKPRVVADLTADLRTGAFVPHAQITDAELTPGTGQQVQFDISGSPSVFMVNGKPYDPATYRDLVLGNVEEWTITSAAGSHPFHIHVNPFEIVAVLDAQGNDLSLPGSPDADYAAMKGTWKDTIFVKKGLRVIVRTRYERYIGEYVLHCHILDHEDQGMMQNVRVLLPDGQGGAMVGGHGGHGSH